MLLDRVGRALLAAEPVLEGERGHADAVQVAGRLDAFRLEDQLAMAAARADHHRGAGGLLLGREEDRDRRVVDVADPVVLGDGPASSRRLSKPGAPLGPERDLLRFLGAGRAADAGMNTTVGQGDRRDSSWSCSLWNVSPIAQTLPSGSVESPNRCRPWTPRRSAMLRNRLVIGLEPCLT